MTAFLASVPPPILLAAAAATFLFAVAVILTLVDKADQRRKDRQDAVRDAAIEREKAANQPRWVVIAVEDPTEDEPLVPIVPGAEPELVEELPVRAQAIEVPREGAVLQGRRRVCTPCLDAWADREPSKICRDCAPVFGRTAVEA